MLGPRQHHVDATSSARTLARWGVAMLVALHGVIHLLGASKGLGWADVTALKQPVSAALGVVWLLSTGLMLLTAGLLAARVAWWWTVGTAALLVSQTAILTSWSDAKAGTLVNAVLLGAVVHGFLSQGPWGYRADYRARVDEALSSRGPAGGVVSSADLDRLPAAVSGYLRRSGALGRPRVSSFRARIHGRIRATADKPWMTFTGEQVNTFHPTFTRQFFMDATRAGLPIDVLHVFVDGHATMRVKAGSLVPLVNASGSDLDRAETVTVFNDLCVLAPSALVDAPVVWHEVDHRHVRGVFTLADRTVTADLTFNDDHELVDFCSDDRAAASGDGRSFLPQRWSTPVGDYRERDSRWVAGYGEGRWHLPSPGAEFSYLEFHLDQITYDVGPTTDMSTAEGRTVMAP